MAEMDWRRAFMRLASVYMHEELSTSRDIADLSPVLRTEPVSGGGDAPLKDELSENPVIIRTQLNKEVAVNITNITRVAENIADALELNIDDPEYISFQGSALILTFKKGDG